MNYFNLDGMDAAHTCKPHSSRCLAPAPQTLAVGRVAIDRVDGLHVRSMGRVDRAHASVKRFCSGSCLGDAQVGRVVFQPDSESNTSVGSFGDSVGILNAQTLTPE